MAKLKTHRPAIRMLPSALATRSTSTERTRGSVWMAIRERILMRDCGLCQPCKREDQVTAAAEVDHIVPLEQGGKDNEANLEATCIPCHRAKSEREARARANQIRG